MPCSLSAAASAEPRATCSMRRLRLRGAHCSLPPAPPSPPSSSGHGSSSTCLFSLLVESLPAQVRQRSSLSGCTKARSASPPGPCSRHPAGNTATCRQVAGEYGDCTSACESGDSAGVYESDSGWPACATLLSFSLFPSDSEPQSQRISPSILATIIFAAFTAPFRGSPHGIAACCAQFRRTNPCSNDHVTVEIFSENTSREPPQCLPQTGDPAWRCGSPHCTTDCH